MSRILKKNRKDTAMKSNTKSYLLYAFGEVFLVMIGILLALFVNNLNEKRKEHKQLRSILKTVRADLVTDTLVASQIVSFYDSINKYSNKVINKEYDASTIESCLLCRSLITIYNPFTIQDKGYNLLKAFGDSDFEQKDSLQTTILQFYKSTQTIIQQSNDFVKAETLKNLSYFGEQPWFIDWMQGRFTDDMRNFFGNSVDFRNRVAKNYILASQNHSGFIKAHKSGAVELIKRIDGQLNEP